MKTQSQKQSVRMMSPMCRPGLLLLLTSKKQSPGKPAGFANKHMWRLRTAQWLAGVTQGFSEESRHERETGKVAWGHPAAKWVPSSAPGLAAAQARPIPAARCQTTCHMMTIDDDCANERPGRCLEMNVAKKNMQ